MHSIMPGCLVDQILLELKWNDHDPVRLAGILLCFPLVLILISWCEQAHIASIFV